MVPGPEIGARNAPPWYIRQCNMTGRCQCLLRLDSRSCASFPTAPSTPAKTLPRRWDLTRARVSQLLKQAETAGLSLERVRGPGLPADRRRPTSSAPTKSARRCTALADQGRHVPAARRRGRRPDRLDVDRAPAPRAAPRHPRQPCSPPNGRRAGRGRRGKAWTAVAGGSLTFSLGWRYEQGAGFLAGLSLAVGVAVVRALEAEGLAGVELEVAERPRAQAPQGRRHPGRAERRCARALDGRRRRRASTCGCPPRSAATSSSRSATSRRSPDAARPPSIAITCSRASPPSSR